MLAVILSVFSCVASNLIIRYISKNHTYNVSFILLMIECLKLLICAITTRCINPKQPFIVRYRFLVNAILYAVVNFLTHAAAGQMEPSIYSVLIQHKLIWVVIFSLLILEKSFGVQQYISMCVVCFGCMLVKMTNVEGEISPVAIGLIIVQGICSSMASVWIEKMMKAGDRPKVSEDESRQKLYWYLSDSFQMYMFGIPIYIFGSLTDRQNVDMPLNLGVCLVGIGVLQGLSLGAVFVYHSSIVRSLVAAMVIVILAIEHAVYSPEIVSGIAMVVLGVLGWVYKKDKK